MKAGMAVLEEAMQGRGETIERKRLVVIGTAEGHIHDIVKTVVASLLQANGYQVHDLGVEDPRKPFVFSGLFNADTCEDMFVTLNKAFAQERVIVLLLFPGYIEELDV